MAVAVDIGPHLHALAHDPFDGKATAIDRGVNIFNMESPAGALDRLGRFVHGDAAIDMKMTPRSQEGRRPGLHRKPPATQWFPAERQAGQRVTDSLSPSSI
jgi:hypothetical protein